jgi:chemotaxis protein MotB
MGSWMTTYSDMVTLLLTFFVLLYSFSSVDAQKFKMLASSLQIAFSGKGDSTGNAVFPLIKEYNIDSFNEKSLSPEEITYIKANDFIIENGLSDQVLTKKDSEGVILEFKDKVLFGTAKAELNTNGTEVLTKVSALLQKLPNKLL